MIWTFCFGMSCALMGWAIQSLMSKQPKTYGQCVFFFVLGMVCIVVALIAGMHIPEE